MSPLASELFGIYPTFHKISPTIAIGAGGMLL